MHIDKLTKPVQRKKWITLQTRYVDGEPMDFWSEPLSLLSLNVTDTTGERLFKEMQQYLTKFQIPFGNILSLSIDNAATMVMNRNSFFKRLEMTSPLALKTNCLSHSCILSAHSKFLSRIKI